MGWVTFSQATETKQQWHLHCGACGHLVLWKPAEWALGEELLEMQVTIPDIERRLKCTKCGESNRTPPAYATIRAFNSYAPSGPVSPRPDWRSK
ncbi:MAG: hypothetical protein ACR2OJ_06965 [Hyphomicrobiales bacterium]